MDVIYFLKETLLSNVLISFLILSSSTALYFPSSETLCFSFCLFKTPAKYPVSFDWSAHTRLTQHH